MRSEQEALRLTISQIKRRIRAQHRAEAIERMQRLMDVRAAFGADENSLKTYISEIERHGY